MNFLSPMTSNSTDNFRDNFSKFKKIHKTKYLTLLNVINCLISGTNSFCPIFHLYKAAIHVNFKICCKNFENNDLYCKFKIGKELLLRNKSYLYMLYLFFIPSII